MSRPTRWTNQSLPQTLQISVFLLYFVAASAVLSRILGLGAPTAYFYLGLRLFGAHISLSGGVSDGGATMLDLVAVVALAWTAAMIASERRIGWQVAVGLAAGLVVIPVVLFQQQVLTSSYLITWVFDIALFALLVHPQSRDYQKIWFK